MQQIFATDKQDPSKSRIVAAAFGGDDFTADFGVYRSDDDRELDFARKQFALVCHAYGITSIDTPYVHFKNIAGLEAQLAYLNEIGMKAKFAIHPTNVDVINRAFCPSAEQVQYYAEMVRLFDEAQSKDKKAAITFQGKMVDIAAYRRAKHTLETYERLKHLL